MAIDPAEFSADIAEATADVPATWTDGSTSFDVLASPADRTQNVQPGGIEARTRISAVLRTSALPPGYSVPAIGRKVSVGGSEYRIVGIDVGAAGSFVVVHLADPYERGA